MTLRRTGWVGPSRARELALVLERRLEAWREQWQIGRNVQMSLESLVDTRDWPQMAPARYWQAGQGNEGDPLVVAWADPSVPAALGAALLGLTFGMAPDICDSVGEAAILAMLGNLCGDEGARQLVHLHLERASSFTAEAASTHITLRIADHSIEYRASAAWCDRLVPVTRPAAALTTRSEALGDIRVPVSFRLPLGEVAIADMAALCVGDILLAEPNVIELLGESGAPLANGRLACGDGERAVTIL